MTSEDEDEDVGLFPVHLPTSPHEGIYHLLVYEQSSDRLVSASEAFSDGLDVGDYTLLLPGMHGSRAAHPAHLYQSALCQM